MGDEADADIKPAPYSFAPLVNWLIVIACAIVLAVISTPSILSALADLLLSKS